MQGQMFSALFNRSKNFAGDDERAWSWKPYKVFQLGMESLGVSFPTSALDDDQLSEYITHYLTTIGSSSWEKTFQWDEC